MRDLERGKESERGRGRGIGRERGRESEGGGRGKESERRRERKRDGYNKEIEEEGEREGGGNNSWDALNHQLKMPCNSLVNRMIIPSAECCLHLCDAHKQMKPGEDIPPCYIL